jgi:hypothetical protein
MIVLRYFSWFLRCRFPVLLQYSKVQKQLMQVVDFHDISTYFHIPLGRCLVGFRPAGSPREPEEVGPNGCRWHAGRRFLSRTCLAQSTLCETKQDAKERINSRMVYQQLICGSYSVRSFGIAGQLDTSSKFKLRLYAILKRLATEVVSRHTEYGLKMVFLL